MGGILAQVLARSGVRRRLHAPATPHSCVNRSKRLTSLEIDSLAQLATNASTDRREFVGGGDIVTAMQPSRERRPPLLPSERELPWNAAL